MATFKTLSVLALSAMVSAHGHVQTIVADGVTYPGAIPHGADPSTPGWAAGNQDNGFVEPNSFSSPDIVCHKNAVAPANVATVSAGGSVTLQWDTWPDSHKGPVIDYLGRCNPDCQSVDKTSISFAKIAQTDFSGADQLMANGNAWTINIPSSVAPGNYVLRHEIIALHSGGQPNGAQAYPQCINLQVTGSGSSTPSGVPATSFYTPNDPGILFDMYQGDTSSYQVPGPALWQG